MLLVRIPCSSFWTDRRTEFGSLVGSIERDEDWRLCAWPPSLVAVLGAAAADRLSPFFVIRAPSVRLVILSLSPLYNCWFVLAKIGHVLQADLPKTHQSRFKTLASNDYRMISDLPCYLIWYNSIVWWTYLCSTQVLRLLHDLKVDLKLSLPKIIWLYVSSASSKQCFQLFLDNDGHAHFANQSKKFFPLQSMCMELLFPTEISRFDNYLDFKSSLLTICNVLSLNLVIALLFSFSDISYFVLFGKSSW